MFLARTLPVLFFFFGLLLVTGPPASGQATGLAQEIPPAPNDYSKDGAWLCRPGVQGACDVDLTTTVIAPGGKLSIETWKADKNAPVDCFYVYPTVSNATAVNSDMTPTADEKNVIAQQFARFGSKCRLFAPMYRQVTRSGLAKVNARPQGEEPPEIQLAVNDVRDAWNFYLAHDNGGRGFILIGHSQGAQILERLIKGNIEGRPVAKQMVSAILAGATVAVPEGKDVGGEFLSTRLCRSAAQTGCIVTFATYRDTEPPAANALFGHVRAPGQKAGCTNPAQLSGKGEQLDAYLSAKGTMIVSGRLRPLEPWASSGEQVSTLWVKLPGMLTAKCTSNENATYLEMTVHPDADGKRHDNVIGYMPPVWGLHLLDMNLSLGNLVDLVGKQAAAWQESKAK